MQSTLLREDRGRRGFAQPTKAVGPFSLLSKPNRPERTRRAPAATAARESGRGLEPSARPDRSRCPSSGFRRAVLGPLRPRRERRALHRDPQPIHFRQSGGAAGRSQLRAGRSHRLPRSTRRKCAPRRCLQQLRARRRVPRRRGASECSQRRSDRTGGFSSVDSAGPRCSASQWWPERWWCPVRAGLPSLQDVLANICRGRAVYICLTREQKRELRDSEGRIALDVLKRRIGWQRQVPGGGALCHLQGLYVST
jgi:hypothetical protein